LSKRLTICQGAKYRKNKAESQGKNSWDGATGS
jgi:hypothetical protein